MSADTGWRPGGPSRLHAERAQLTAGSTWLQTIRGAPHAQGAPIQDVRVNHRRADIRMAEQLLDCSNVVAILKEMRRKGWRNVWQLTRFAIAARRTAAVTARWTADSCR